MKSYKNPGKFLLVALLCFLAVYFPSPAGAQTSQEGNTLRTLDQLFPGLNESQKNEIFGGEVYINSLKKNEVFSLIPAPGSGIDLISAVLKTNPSFLAEALLIVPHPARMFDKVDAYNSLGKIKNLKGRLYHSYTKKADIPLFEDATRIESANRNHPIPDPPPAKTLPVSETNYIRIKDVNFGISYYRSQLSVSPYGVTYYLTNTKNLTYLLFIVMREEKFSATIYLEPIAEGMLVYSLTGADASDFISSKVHIPTAIEKRLAVFIDWVCDGLKPTN